jgi:hypothetical protein
MYSEACYTADNGRLYVPDRKVSATEPNCTYVACRGYSASLAVRRSGVTLGWVDVHALGYPTVKAWMADQKTP